MGKKTQVITLYSSGITCVNCTNTIEGVLKDLDGIVKTKAFPDKQQVIVYFDENAVSINSIIDEIADVGFAAKTISEELNATHQVKKEAQNKQRFYLTRFIASFALGLPLLLMSSFAMPLSWPMMLSITIASLLVCAYAGFDIYHKAFKLWQSQKKVNADSLFTISTTIALGASLAAFFFPFFHFEFGCVLLTFASRHLGRYLEATMKSYINQNLDFMSRLPKKVLRQKNYCESIPLAQYEEVDINDIQVGDIILVSKGQVVPLDGEIINHTPACSIYRTLINGNQHAEIIGKDKSVLAGMKCHHGQFALKVTKTMNDCYLKERDHILSNPKESQTDIETYAEKLINIFIPGVLITTLIATAITLPLFGPMVSLHTALALLVGACPCTLGFIIPFAVKVGGGQSAALGATITNVKAIEKAEAIDTIIFDLNGTLTNDSIEVSHTEILDKSLTESALWQLVRTIETQSQSKNIIGLGLLEHAQTKLEKSSPATVPQLTVKCRDGGLVGQSQEDDYAIGNAFLMQSLDIAIKSHSQRIYIAKNGQCIAYVDIQDKLRPQAKKTIGELKSLGKKLILLTGADKKTAQSYARRLGIESDNIQANCHGNEGKIAFLETLKTPYAFIGDGANDVEALSRAPIGIAMYSGDIMSKKNADVIIHKDSIYPVVHFFNQSTATMRIIKQNFNVSLGYNLLVMLSTTAMALSLGAMAPSVMALSMGLQSLMVLANTLRLYRGSANASNSDEEVSQSAEKQQRPLAERTCCQQATLSPQVQTSPPLRQEKPTSPLRHEDQGSAKVYF